MPEYLYRLQLTRPTMLADGPTPEERAAVGAHAAYLERLAGAGVVLLFGRTQTADAGTFGIVLLRTPTEAAARVVMVEDPAVVAGVMRAELFPFRIAGVGPGLTAG